MSYPCRLAGRSQDCRAEQEHDICPAHQERLSDARSYLADPSPAKRWVPMQRQPPPVLRPELNRPARRAANVCQEGHSLADAYVYFRPDGKRYRRCRPCKRAYNARAWAEQS